MNFKSNRIALAVSAASLISVSQGAAAFDFFNFVGGILTPPPALVPLLAPKHAVVHADVSTAATQGCIIAAEGIPQGEITGDVLQDCLLKLDDYCNGYHGGDPTVTDAQIGGEGGACVNTATISQEIQVGGNQQIVLHSTIGYSLADVIKVTEVAGEGTIPDKEGLEIAIAGAGVYARAWVEGWPDSDTGWKPVGANYIGNAAIYNGMTPPGAGGAALEEPSEPLAEGSIFYSTAPFIAAFQNPGCNELGCLVPDKVTVKMEFLTIAVMPGGPFNSYVNGADINVDIGNPPSGPGAVPALVAVTRGKVTQVIADIEGTSGVTLVDYYPDED